MPDTPCPICHHPPAPEFTPFCSKRCADADLGRWLTGSYSVPAEDEEETRLDPEDDVG